MDDWVSVSGNVEVAGVRCEGRNRDAWNKCVEDEMKVLGLHSEWAVFISGICGGTSCGQASNS